MTQQRHEIVVYPSRAKLLRYLLLYALVEPIFLAMSVAGFSGLSQGNIHDVRVYVLLAVSTICVSWIGVAALFTAYRAVVRKPAVIVNNEGITDNCSFIAGGVGLMRWHEIRDLFAYTYHADSLYHKVRRPYLVILPADAHAVLARRGPLVQLLLRAFTLTLPARTSLPEWMLSMPVEELLSEIRTRYQTQLQLNRVTVLADDPPARIARQDIYSRRNKRTARTNV